jgi:2-oxoglutarate dehydrogenase E2 component (dihydrolipoamide succinyltransferase)
MAVAVVVPSGGESVSEGRLAQWLVADGSTVKMNQPIFEFETDKITTPVNAPTGGVVKFSVEAGSVIVPGQEVASIDPAGAPAASAASPPPPKATVQKETPVASPAAASAIRNQNLDASTIAATGPGNRITKDDVLAHLASNGKSAPASTPPAPAPKPSTDLSKVTAQVVDVKLPRTDSPRETRTPMSTIRKRIASRLLESQNTTATLTTFNEADMTAIQDLRAKYNERFEKKYGVKIGFMSVFVKAAIEALRSFPIVNSRIDGNDVVQQNFYDIGVAVSTEKGLMVPVIRDADQMSFADIEKAIGDVAKRARDNKIGLKDLEGGTFTITNGGIFGSMLSTPILNPPQTAILGMHSIQKRAVVVNDAIVIRPMMYLALSYDHRLLDGREAVQFLVRIKECLENPERMLFEV